MSFDPTANLNGVTNILRAVSERQRLTSNNIVNANTPGYQALEVTFAQLLSKMDSPFETALSQKMGAVKEEAYGSGAPVNLQKELIDMQKNNLFYGMATRRASSIFNMLRTSAQIGR
jgi:flagellar basal body rod protein FlgB